MEAGHRKDRWSSRLGVILAVAGSAVGLGNFLRFPGQAAQYGGGAFMIAYFISLILLGIPICWVEWTLGRYGGERGFNSAPGIFNAILHHPAGKYVGVIGVIIPVVIYMYYVYIESWCVGYAVNFALGNLNLADTGQFSQFFSSFIGDGEDGSAVKFGVKHVGGYLALVFVVNFFFIYRGLAKGIEFFCRYAMPALMVLAILILVRVLTLGAPIAGEPEQNINNGLGYMWNPDKVFLQGRAADGTWTNVVELVGQATMTEETARAATDPNLRLIEVTMWEQLKNAQLWLAAAGQIFFSLSVGFGVIIVYASYLRRQDDVMLSGLTATATNEFCEVALGGLITLPAAYVFLGAAQIAGQGTFGLGFKVLPMVLSQMPAGTFFGITFFVLLFLAAVTSSLSMLQPGIAFLEEGLNLDRKQSCALLGLITALGCGFVVFFSRDMKALDTIDFWAGTFLLFVLATIQVIIFGWIFGVERGWKEAHQGAEIRVPGFFKFIIKYICPLYLLIIFAMWVLTNVFGFSFETGEFAPTGYVKDLVGAEANTVAQLSVGLILVVLAFMLLLAHVSGKRWKSEGRHP